MKKIIKQITAVLLSLAAVVSVSATAFAQQEPYQYIEDVELVCNYYDMNTAVLRLKTDEDLRYCICKAELWNKTDNCMIKSFDDESCRYKVSDDKFYLISMDFQVENIFSETAEYYIRIPVDAFNAENCEDRSIPVPTQDVIYSFSGKKLFEENFDPFFSYDGLTVFGYHGDPEAERNASIDWEHTSSANLQFKVSVPPSWQKELTLEAYTDEELKNPCTCVSFEGNKAHVYHYDGLIYIALVDSETGKCYDTVYVKAYDDPNAPHTFGELLFDTASEIIYILSIPFSVVQLTVLGVFGLPFIVVVMPILDEIASIFSR